MSAFADYALYYNALYQDKPYAQEADFVLSLVQREGATPRTVLDLGCGTGRHSLELARLGIAAVGVDMSAAMLDMPVTLMRETVWPTPTQPPQFHEGDARVFRTAQSFDMVISLFHVMSYQTTEEDALALLETAYTHLHPQGMFVFDFWYGPGVLHQRPEHRTKVFQTRGGRVTRTAEPVLYLNDNRVDVQYDIVVESALSPPAHIHEVHALRYWFMPELHYLARSVGFTLLGYGAWMKQTPPTEEDWAAWMMVRK